MSSIDWLIDYPALLKNLIQSPDEIKLGSFRVFLATQQKEENFWWP